MWTKLKTGFQQIVGLNFLLVVSISACWLSGYLFDADSPAIPWPICVCLHLVAWISVVTAWREFHRKHGGRPGFYYAVVLTLVVFVGPLRNAFFPLTTTSTEVAAYKSLSAAVRADDLQGVRSSLRLSPVPAFEVEPAEQYCGEDAACKNATKPLFVAVKHHDTGIASELLHNGAVPTTGIISSDPVILAATLGDVPMLGILLEHTDNPNDGGNDCFPLWYAVQNGRIEAVSFLLARGANPNTFGSDDRSGGQTLLQMANQRHFNEIAKIIARAGGK